MPIIPKLFLSINLDYLQSSVRSKIDPLAALTPTTSSADDSIGIGRRDGRKEEQTNRETKKKKTFISTIIFVRFTDRIQLYYNSIIRIVYASNCFNFSHNLDCFAPHRKDNLLPNIDRPVRILYYYCVHFMYFIIYGATCKH